MADQSEKDDFSEGSDPFQGKTDFLRIYCGNCLNPIGFKTTSEPTPTGVYCLDCRNVVIDRWQREQKLTDEYQQARRRIWSNGS